MLKGLILLTLLLPQIALTVAQETTGIRYIAEVIPSVFPDEKDIYIYKEQPIGRTRTELGDGVCKVVDRKHDGSYQVIYLKGGFGRSVPVKIPVIHVLEMIGDCQSEF